MGKLLSLLLLLFTIPLSAQTLFERQPYDHIWLFGQGSTSSAAFSNARIDFNQSPPAIQQFFAGVPFDITGASISGNNGQLQCYTNAISIYNASHQVIENGERINPGEFTNNWVEYGYPLPQGTLLLPQPETNDHYYLFYGEILRAEIPDGPTNTMLEFKYAEIDMTANNGNGLVLQKEVLLLQDTFDYGKITATKHGNGRDWWVVVPYYNGEDYHRFLLTPNGVSDMDKVTINTFNGRSGIGQAVFSPNGSKYINYSGYGTGEPNLLAIHDFNRCTGEFSNPLLILNVAGTVPTGIAVSENSRFLYESSAIELHQIDLTAEDVTASRTLVGEYDGFFDEIDIFRTIFFLQQLAPDGRIIMNSAAVRYLHTIESPNKKGMACNFLQHSINLPVWNARTLPNFPYFGLGPWDGSPCDTLNINNPAPEAAFEYTADSVDYALDFFDGSHYAYEWEWDFGDGSNTSTAQHPLHSYTEPGAYEVCLTVSNVTGSDLYCETIQLGTTSTQEVFAAEISVRVYPNPAHDILQLELELPNDGMFELLNNLGQIVKNISLSADQLHWQVSVADLPSGIYTYRIVYGNRVQHTDKIIIEN